MIKNHAFSRKPHVVTIPSAHLEDLIQLVKSKLSIPHVKVIGERSAKCTKIVIAHGAAGGTRQI